MKFIAPLLLLFSMSAFADPTYYNTFFLETGSFKMPDKSVADSNPIQWDWRNVKLEYSGDAEITKYNDGSVTITYRSKK